MSEWQPIMTFPPDSVFDVWATYYGRSGKKTGCRYTNVWWDGNGFVAGKIGYISGVTHWMPSPEPPREV